MLSDEKVNENFGVIETINNSGVSEENKYKMLSLPELIDHDLNIKLKVIEETEKSMIDKFKKHLVQMLIKKTNGVDLSLDIPTVDKIGIYIIDELEKEFNEKWFK